MCKVFINPEACGNYDLRYNGIDEIGKSYLWLSLLFKQWENSLMLGDRTSIVGMSKFHYQE